MLTAFAPFVFFDFLPFPKFALRLRWMMGLAGNMVQRLSGKQKRKRATYVIASSASHT